MTWDDIGGQVFNDPDSGVAPGTRLINGQWVAPNLNKKGDKYFLPTGGSPDDLRAVQAYAPYIEQYLKSGDLVQDDNGTWHMSTQAQDQFSEVAGIKAQNAGGFFSKSGPFQAFMKTIGVAMGVAGGLSALGVGAAEGGIGLSGAGGVDTLAGGAGGDALAAGSELTSFNQYLPQNFQQSFPGISTPGSSGLIPGAASSGMLSGVSNLASAAMRMLSGSGTADDAKAVLQAGGIAAALAGSAAAVSKGGLGGSTSQTTSTNLPAMSAEELELIRLNGELTKRQLSAIDELQPFQKQMLQLALEQMQAQATSDAAVNGAVSPEEQAALAKQNYQSALKLGPIQEEIAQMQLDAIRRNGAATPEQEALIKQATDSAVGSANADIDANTSRGIGLIADELSNSRGLRLSDSPMSGEAALLAREGVVQKGAVEKSLRANQANAQLNYPLAVQGVQTASGNAAASIAQNAKAFQEELRQRAFQNRMSLTGNATSTGIGLSSVGGGNGALSALSNQRLAGGTRTEETSRGIGLSDVGTLGLGLAQLGKLVF